MINSASLLSDTACAPVQTLFTQNELASRWGRSVSAIGLASALGVGPKYIKVDGALRYPLEEVRKYEQLALASKREVGA